MEILKFPDSLLFEKCEQVNVFGEELPLLLDSMFEIMKKAGGIGLAANQVGFLHRMFVMEGPEKEKLFLVNPRIIRKSIVSADLKEGCLSAPGEFLQLPRVVWVHVTFQDETGLEHKRVFKDIWSVCVQHEIEHLNGESFLENKSIPKVKRKELAKKWKLRKKK